jgi:hypothetical protein
LLSDRGLGPIRSLLSAANGRSDNNSVADNN